VIAATPLAPHRCARTVRGVTAAVEVEEPDVPEEEPRELPPLVLTGDDETDETLALLRQTTQAIHEAQDRVAELSQERKRLVLALRRVADLTHEHVGLRIRTGGHEGILGAITHRDDEWSQLLLLVEGMPPLLPIVGAGAPVDLID
jgi:hypothetical protein